MFHYILQTRQKLSSLTSGSLISQWKSLGYSMCIKWECRFPAVLFWLPNWCYKINYCIYQHLRHCMTVNMHQYKCFAESPLCPRTNLAAWYRPFPMSCLHHSPQELLTPCGTNTHQGQARHDTCTVLISPVMPLCLGDRGQCYSPCPCFWGKA